MIAPILLPDSAGPAPVRPVPGAALRAAGRAALRAPAAALLAAGLIAAPVAVLTTFDIQERTAASPGRAAAQFYGAADAKVWASDLVEDPNSDDGTEGAAFDAAAAEFLAAVPPGVRVVRAVDDLRSDLEITGPDGTGATVRPVAALLGEPMHRQFARLVGGTPPGPADVALDPTTARSLGLLDGETLKPDAAVRVGERRAPVTGLVSSSCPACPIVLVTPGSALDRAIGESDAPWPEGFLLQLSDGDPAAVAEFVAAYDIRTRDDEAAGSPGPALVLPSPSYDEPSEDRGYDDLQTLGKTLPIWFAGLVALALLARGAIRSGLARLDDIRPRAVLAYGALLGTAGALGGMALGVAGAVTTADGYGTSLLSDEYAAGGWTAGPAELAIFATVAVVWGALAADWTRRRPKDSWR